MLSGGQLVTNYDNGQPSIEQSNVKVSSSPKLDMNSQFSPLARVQSDGTFPDAKESAQMISNTMPSTPALRIQEELKLNRAKEKNGKHLVLDLDETLVHTFESADRFQNFIGQLTDKEKERIYLLKFQNGEELFGYIRPYAEDFLKVAFEEFETVGVWSAGTKYYVDMIVELLFKDHNPNFVMSRQDCNELKITVDEPPCRYKPLEVIYHKFPDHNESNTVIIDDRHDICALNCMNNIRIPEFQMNDTTYPIMVNDHTLLTLARWFQSPEFRGVQDVRLIKSRSPFKI